MKKLLLSMLASMALLTGYWSDAFALGECGLACCIAGAATSGVTLAQRVGFSVQYEYTQMKTLKEGAHEVSPDEVINRNWMMGGKFSVPLEMTMQKVSVIAAVPVTERFQVLGIVPYVFNNMTMRTKNKMGMVMDMKMASVEGIGDVTLMGLYTAYTDAPIRPTQRLTLGLGLKTPTGSNDEKTGSGTFVHAMMQAGTGSWDPLFLVNYMHAFYPLVLQANLFYHLSTRGDEGYAFGDQFNYDLIARYQVASYVNVGLEINGVHAGKDSDADGKFSRPTTSLIDNPNNTGLDSIFISPTVQLKIPGTGGSMEFKYQQPIFQSANGIQQVVDWRVITSVTWNF